MATYQFLSDDWLAEARSIRAEFNGKGDSIELSIRMNLVVGLVPFGDGTVEAHVDTSTGELILDTGHIDPVDWLGLTELGELRYGKSGQVDVGIEEVEAGGNVRGCH